jgi:DDE_Tnp_1-associated/Transposase DDE domain
MDIRGPLRLHDFLAEIPDPREPSGRRHPLTAILAHACCAILCGCRGYAAVAQWGRDQPIGLMHRLGYTRRPPSYGAVREVFLRLDVDAFERAVARWVARVLPEDETDAETDEVPLRAVAIDGKTSRGSRRGGVPAVHLLAMLDQATGCVLSQARVPAETNEHKAALRLLEGLALEGRVVTGDAAFCQRDLSRAVVEAGGHFLWKIDANQPTLLADVEAACEPPVSPLRPTSGRRRTR